PLPGDNGGKTGSLQYGLDPSERARIFIRVHAGFVVLKVQEHACDRNIRHTEVRGDEKLAGLLRNRLQIVENGRQVLLLALAYNSFIAWAVEEPRSDDTV